MPAKFNHCYYYLFYTEYSVILRMAGTKIQIKKPIVTRNFAAVINPLSLPSKLLHSVPADDDSEWTSKLHKIPDVNFSSIYNLQ